VVDLIPHGMAQIVVRPDENASGPVVATPSIVV
jgi:hypothetical protein